MSASIRVGVMLDGLSVPEWQALMLDDIVAEEGLSLALLVVDCALRRPGRVSPLVSLYQRLDARLNRGRSAILRPRDVSLPQGRAPILEVKSETDLAAIDAHELDVVIRLGFDRLAGRPVRARHGVWSLEIGEGKDGDDGAPGLRELYEDRPTVPVAVVAAWPDGRRRVIDRSHFATHASSLLLSRVPVYGAISSHFLRQLRRLRDTDRWLGEDEAPVVAPGERPSAARVRMAPLLLRCGQRITRAAVKRPIFDQYHWRVAVAPREAAMNDVEALARAPFRLVDQPSDCLYGDPFPFDHDGATWLFMEILPYRTYRGVLAVAKLDDRGVPGPFTTILERDDHLSWPSVFRHDGAIYMIPESQQRRTIELYRCERFPDRWRLDRVLLERVAAVDTVFLPHDGRLWLFTGIARPPGPIELHLYHADELRGPWRPHALNPVVSDVTRARPAGAILHDDGTLVRSGQDCSLRYGRAVSFNRIHRLTPEEYDEAPIARVGPEDLRWHHGAVGTHTYNRSERFVATDICTVKFRGARWLRRLRHALA